MGTFIDHTGEVNRANNGMLMTIIACRGCHDIDIQFEDGEVICNKSYNSFKSGSIKNPNIAESTYYKRKGKSKSCTIFGVEYESFKKAVEHYNLNEDTVRSYKDKYKLTGEQAIDHYINGTDYSGIKKLHGVRVNNFTKIVVIEGVEYNYKQAMDKYNLSEKGIDKVMRDYNITDRGEAIIFCIQHNLAKINRKTSGTVIIRGKQFNNITEALKYFHISTAKYKNTREKLNSSDDYEAIVNDILDERELNYIKTNRGIFKSFKDLSDFIGIDSANIISHSKSNSKEDKLKAVTELVIGASINKEGVLIIPDKIEFSIKTKTKLSRDELDFNKKLLNYCKQLNINIASAHAYKSTHKELSVEQIILHFRPDCCINLLGQLIITDKNNL